MLNRVETTQGAKPGQAAKAVASPVQAKREDFASEYAELTTSKMTDADVRGPRSVEVKDIDKESAHKAVALTCDEQAFRVKNIGKEQPSEASSVITTPNVNKTAVVIDRKSGKPATKASTANPTKIGEQAKGKSLVEGGAVIADSAAPIAAPDVKVVDPAVGQAIEAAASGDGLPAGQEQSSARVSGLSRRVAVESAAIASVAKDSARVVAPIAVTASAEPSMSISALELRTANSRASEPTPAKDSDIVAASISAVEVGSTKVAVTPARVHTVDAGSVLAGSFGVESPDSTQLSVDGHRTLTANATTLEVGVLNGTHGWLKIRAEMNDGLVTASLTAGSSVAREVLHRELPSIANFLSSENVAVKTVTVNPAANVGAAAGAYEGSSEQRGSREQPAMDRGDAMQSAKGEENSDVKEYGGIYNDFHGQDVSLQALGLGGGTWLSVMA